METPSQLLVALHCKLVLFIGTCVLCADALVESDGSDVIGALQGFHVGAVRIDSALFYTTHSAACLIT